MIEIWKLVVLVILFVILQIWWEQHKTSISVSFGDDGDADEDEEGDPEVIELIQNAATRRQLLEIAGDYDLVGNENATMLQKALQLNLDPEDWVDLYQAAEEDSEFERVAIEKAENALED